MSYWAGSDFEIKFASACIFLKVVIRLDFGILVIITYLAVSSAYQTISYIYIYVVFNRGLVRHICITRQVSALVHETAWASADLLSIRSLQTVFLKFVSKYDNFLLITQSLYESVQTEQRLNAMQSTLYMTTIYLLYAGWRWWHPEWSHCSKATRYGTI